MTRNVRTVGERIEKLLGDILSGPSRQTAEEIVRLLMELYGDGLTRVLAIVRAHDPTLVHRIAQDELLESLLLVHDLHPFDVHTRIRRALDRVRPYLDSHAGGVKYLGIDSNGVARLRLEGNRDGCPSASLTVRQTIEQVVRDAAPETSGVEVSGVTGQASTTLLQIGMRPPPDWRPGPGQAQWSRLPNIDPSVRVPVSTAVNGVPVLVCSIHGSLYAYRDACAACGSSLSESELDGGVVTCSTCDRRFDLELAGRCLDDAQQLDALPLQSDSRGVRVAVARTVAS